jgi:hypothetical protein
MIHDPSKGAIARGSPGDYNSHAGKYGESTPLRQRGGGGLGFPLTRSVRWNRLLGARSGRPFTEEFSLSLDRQ